MGRPEKRVQVWVEDTEFGEDFYVEVMPADLVAAVREGVESGTIEGEVEVWCEVHNHSHLPTVEDAMRFSIEQPEACRYTRRLVIGPVSDGGSET